MKIKFFYFISTPQLVEVLEKPQSSHSQPPQLIFGFARALLSSKSLLGVNSFLGHFTPVKCPKGPGELGEIH